MSDTSGISTCENCGKRVLPTDTLCWHCGWKLPRRTTPVDLTLNPRTQAASPTAPVAPVAATTPSYDLRAIAVYGSLTVLLIIALLLVMRALGRQPLLVSIAGLDIGDEWIQLTDSQLRYTFGVPAGWQWLDVPFRDQQAVLKDLTERQPYINRALNPLGTVAGDVTIEGVGLGSQAFQLPEPVPFVVIATSPRLRQLDPQAALDLLAENTLPALDQHIDTSIPLQPQARFSVLDAANGFQCLHMFVAKPETAGYLVAACAPQLQFGTIQRDLASILNSFQLIEK